jgi:hypothetical protein
VIKPTTSAPEVVTLKLQASFTLTRYLDCFLASPLSSSPSMLRLLLFNVKHAMHRTLQACRMRTALIGVLGSDVDQNLLKLFAATLLI